MIELVEEGLSFAQEGADVRATTDDGRSYLFQRQASRELAECYRLVASSAREHLRPRFESFDGANLDEAEFRGLTREAALDFLYVAVINRLPREPERSEWDYPATRRVIERWAQRRFRRNAAAARALSAHLMGLSPEQYEEFRRAEERYANR